MYSSSSFMLKISNMISHTRILYDAMTRTQQRVTFLEERIA